MMDLGLPEEGERPSQDLGWRRQHKSYTIHGCLTLLIIVLSITARVANAVLEPEGA